MSRPHPALTYEVDTPDARAARLAAGQWGVLDLDELRTCGVNANAVAWRRRTGRAHLVYRGVYAWGHNGLILNARHRIAR